MIENTYLKKQLIIKKQALQKENQHYFQTINPILLFFLSSLKFSSGMWINVIVNMVYLDLILLIVYIWIFLKKAFLTKHCWA